MPYEPPTVADIRSQSVVVFAEFGFPEPTGTDPDPLERLLDEAKAELRGVLRRFANLSLDYAQIDAGTDEGAAVTTILDKVHRMWVEWLAASSDPSIVDVVADWDVLSSGTGRSHRNISPNLQMWHLWPALDRLLRYLVQLYKAEITVTDLPPDVPVVEHVGKYPKPGLELMREGPGIDSDHQSPPAPFPPFSWPGGLAPWLWP